MTSLLTFLKLVLSLLPRLLWWALGGLLFALLNNIFSQELWPNTPAARPFFELLTLVCLMALPWLAARTAWRLAETVQSYFWKAIWRLVAVVGYGGAGLALLGGLLGSCFIVMDLVAVLSR